MVENLENEIWIPVEGYESSHMVSNLGRIKVLDRIWSSGVNNATIRSKPPKLVSQSDRRGYKKVALVKDSLIKSFNVHRIVARAFIPNPNNKSQINHINGIKDDNRVENLEWCTPSENAIHAYKIGLNVSGKRGLHSGARKIKCDTLGLSFKCIRDAADRLGINCVSVWKVCNNRLIHVRGLTFRYI